MPKLLDDIVSTKGSEIAVADEFGSTTWSQFDERVRRLINGLKDHGVGPGDTIAMMMGNRRECFEIFQACAHLGVTYVPVNWHWVPDELAYVLEDADVKVLLVGKIMTVPTEKAPANSVPAAAVRRRELALFGFTGRKEHVGGLVSWK